MVREKLIQKIIGKNKFLARFKTYLDFCPNYQEGNPNCHNLPTEQHVCFSCYCPHYRLDQEHPEGDCEINSPKGKWFYNPNIISENRRIWDCSDCDFMHTEQGVREFLKSKTEIELQEILEMSPEELRNNYYQERLNLDFMLDRVIGKNQNQIP